LYEELDVRAQRSNPPALFNTLTELPRALFEFGSLCTFLPTMFPALSLLSQGDRHPLLLIPGFLAGDQSLGILKRYLSCLGYDAQTWGYGQNTGRPEHLFDHLPEKLQQLADESGEPVSLIGQSLGGVYARELAREHPEVTRQVITLGSPFGANTGGTTIQALQELFRQSSGMSVEDMADLMAERDSHISPDVPVTAIYSKGDGVVHWEVCREADEDHHTQNIEVPGSHCGMGFNSLIYFIIANRLSQDMDSWGKFSWTSCW
jgi:pimeloyl-ACP methyl ester carboxylesterase